MRHVSEAHSDDLARMLEAMEASEAAAPAPVGVREDRGELGELVTLASALRSTTVEGPRSEFRDALRDRLRIEASQLIAAPAAVTTAGAATPATSSLGEGWRGRFHTLRRSVALATASATGAFALGSVGMVAAAEHAQPGEALYGMKLASESVRRSLAADTAAIGRLELAFAERRLDEVVAGARTMSSDVLIDTLGAMDTHTRRGVDHMLDAYAQGGGSELLRDVSAFTARQRDGLISVGSELPMTVTPFVSASLDVLAQVEARIAAAAFGCTDCDDVPSGHDPRPGGPAAPGSEDAGSDGGDGPSHGGPETADGPDAQPSPEVSVTASPGPSLPGVPQVPGDLPTDLPDGTPDVQPSSPLDGIVNDIIESTDSGSGVLEP